MRTHWKLGLAAGVASAVGSAVLLDELRAQSPGPTGGRVAVLDIVKVFNEYKQTVDINQELEQRRREVQAEIEARDQKLEVKTRELEAFHPDSADYNKRRRELFRLRIDRDNYMQLAEIEVRDMFRVWTRRTYEEICDAAALVAQEQGYELVVIREKLEEDIPDAATLKQHIRLRKVIYAHPSVDITDAVLARINRAYEERGKKPSLGPIGL